MGADDDFVDGCVEVLKELYPLQLAESWDNVGVLVDSMEETRGKKGTVFLTNDLTEKVLEEAIQHDAKLIITYHPRPFMSFKKLTKKDVTQRIVLQCVRRGIVIYSPHTCCDNAAGGVNDWLAEGFTKLAEGAEVTTVTPSQLPGMEGCGSGRIVRFKSPVTLQQAVDAAKQHMGLTHVRLAVAEKLLGIEAAERAQSKINSIGVQAGSGGSVLKDCGAELFVTGEMGHHDVLAVNASGSSVILTDHTNTERGFLPSMAAVIGDRMKNKGFDITTVVSSVDADPLQVV